MPPLDLSHCPVAYPRDIIHGRRVECATLEILPSDSLPTPHACMLRVNYKVLHACRNMLRVTQAHSRPGSHLVLITDVCDCYSLCSHFTGGTLSLGEIKHLM